MAFQLPTMPNFNITTPPFNPVAQQEQLATLRGLTSENALRSQLAPLQVQEQQQKVAQAQIATQIQQMQLQGQQGLTKWLSEGDTNEEIPPDKFSLNDKIATFVGVDPKDPIMSVVRSMAQHGVPAPILMTEAKGMLERRNEYSKATEEQQKIIKDNYDVWKDATAQLYNDDNPSHRSIMLTDMLPRLQQATHLSPELQSMVQMLQQDPQKAIPIAYNLVAAQDKALGLSKAASEAASAALTAEQKKDPLMAMETNPESYLEPNKISGSIAYLQSRAKDDDSTVASRATRLLGVATTAQQLQLSVKRQEKAAETAVTQGSPTAAAQLLVNGDATLSQLKARGSTPEFIVQTLAEANRLSGGSFNAQQAEANFDIAKSPANVAFFGSAKSLTDKGGTLDQLKAAAKDIPQNQFPIFNSLADWTKAAMGSGPIAKYAAINLGVADDYAKVMGGGTASDTGRLQGLNLVPAKASPEARDAAIEGIRGAVGSQLNSRIGSNPIMKKMYGDNLPPQAQGGGKLPESLTAAQITAYATAHNVSEAEVKKQAKAQGIKVPD